MGPSLKMSVTRSTPGLFRLIASDFRAKAKWLYGQATPRSVLKAYLADGAFAMIVYRFMQASQRWHITPLAMLFNKLNVCLAGCVIGRKADFGPEFVIVHSNGIVINSAVVGGSRVTLEHQVTIGAEKRRSPRLGDDVFIGAGARVIGDLHVGNSARIGANAVVLNDVPDGCTAVGIPARVVDSSVNGADGD